ncbi:BREAKING OF ASYMMETRY IN THE STOMATAL LINEAGE [Spatholobus suberectus]|nr:BREAKING OF ASYMMETRY IN THE STOMATAL LINEAGE [Spatholobus suberectus]
MKMSMTAGFCDKFITLSRCTNITEPLLTGLNIVTPLAVNESFQIQMLKPKFPSFNLCPKRQPNNPIIKDKDGGVHPIGNKFDHLSWSLSADEDYIVFCFGKDVAQGDKGVKSEALIKGLNGLHENSRPVNRKLKYGEVEEQVSDQNIPEKRSNANQHHNDQDWSAESSNSDQSEGSRSSFVFPVLDWEWIGSPEQMPKSEGLHLRKHKARAVKFQCCRF